VLLPATVGVALLAVVLMFAMGNLKLFASQSAPRHAAPHATPRPTATHPLPTATATIAQPTVTATPNPQVALDSQAASAFRAITLAAFSDGACSSGAMTTHFNGGTPVFVNLCMANTATPGPVTVAVMQNGATIRTLISNQYTSRGSFYSQGHTLGAGSYDMLVTVEINGNRAVAKDISFTVG
jgi:hypothetical protein